MTPVARTLLVLGLATTTLACGDDTAGSGGGVAEGGADGAGQGGDAASGGGGGDPTGGEADPICDRYVACVAATMPAALEQVQAQYGDDGACWDDPDLAAACVSGCREGLSDASEASPDEPLCDECVEDADCVDPAAGSCDGGTCRIDPDVHCFIEVVNVVLGVTIDAECVALECAAEIRTEMGPGGTCDGVCEQSEPCFEGDAPSPSAQTLFDCFAAADCDG